MSLDELKTEMAARLITKQDSRKDYLVFLERIARDLDDLEAHITPQDFTAEVSSLLSDLQFYTGCLISSFDSGEVEHEL